MLTNRFAKDIGVNQPLQVVESIINKGINETFVEPIPGLGAFNPPKIIMNKEDVYGNKFKNPIKNDGLRPSVNPMQTIHVQMKGTMNSQDHGPKTFTINVGVQIPNQLINGK